jgi:hypothetical protein
MFKPLELPNSIIVPTREASALELILDAGGDKGHRIVRNKGTNDNAIGLYLPRTAIETPGNSDVDTIGIFPWPYWESEILVKVYLDRFREGEGTDLTNFGQFFEKMQVQTVSFNGRYFPALANEFSIRQSLFFPREKNLMERLGNQAMILRRGV